MGFLPGGVGIDLRVGDYDRVQNINFSDSSENSVFYMLSATSVGEYSLMTVFNLEEKIIREFFIRITPAGENTPVGSLRCRQISNDYIFEICLLVDQEVFAALEEAHRNGFKFEHLVIGLSLNSVEYSNTEKYVVWAELERGYPSRAVNVTGLQIRYTTKQSFSDTSNDHALLIDSK